MFLDIGFCEKNMPCGSHIVMLYENKDDILEVLPKFLSSGVLGKGLNIVSYSDDETMQKTKVETLRLAGIENAEDLPVEFVKYKEAYFNDGYFSENKVYDLFIQNLQNMGHHTHIRTFGDMDWVEGEMFDTVKIYEQGLTEKFCKGEVLILCAYPAKKMSTAQTIEILEAHDAIIFKKDGRWIMSEPVERKMMDGEISELRKFNRFAIDRELKMIELKKKIRELEEELDQKQ